MSDEPLYCTWCGHEVGSKECTCGVSTWESAPPREKRYCDVCGVIPAQGKHCKFYDRGGNNTGCET